MRNDCPFASPRDSGFGHGAGGKVVVPVGTGLTGSLLLVSAIIRMPTDKTDYRKAKDCSEIRKVV
jgi:hypothetical protein